MERRKCAIALGLYQERWGQARGMDWFKMTVAAAALVVDVE